MKTLMITLGLVAFGLATAEAGNGHPYGKQATAPSGDHFARGGGGGDGNGQRERTRKRDGSGGNCEGDGECDGTGKGRGRGNGPRGN